MIKKTVQYKDYENKPHSQDLYFHLKVDTLTDNMHLTDRVAAMQELFEGDERELTTPEKQEILDVVKLFINLSYGKRVNVDGEAKFRQRPEILEDFRDSGAYDAFLWELFQNPESAMNFLNEVMPSQLVEAAQQAEVSYIKAPQDYQKKQTSPAPVVSVGEEVVLDDSQVDDAPPSDEVARLRRQLEEAEAAAKG